MLDVRSSASGFLRFQWRVSDGRCLKFQYGIFKDSWWIFWISMVDVQGPDVVDFWYPRGRSLMVDVLMVDPFFWHGNYRLPSLRPFK